MCIDPIKSIQQIASFLNLKDIDHKVIEKVLLHSSFDEMKNNSCIGLNHIRKGKSITMCKHNLTYTSWVNSSIE